LLGDLLIAFQLMLHLFVSAYSGLQLTWSKQVSVFGCYRWLW